MLNLSMRALIMRTINKISTVLALSTALCSTAYADNAFVAIGPRISTQGIGLEARTPIADGFFGRINGNYFQYTKNYNDGEIDLKGKLTLLSVPIMLDWHPFEGSGFRLSAGFAYNGNKLKATGTAAKGATLQGVFYTASEIGSVTAELKIGSTIAGVASIGYDGSFTNNSPLSFNCEAGVMYAGKPKLTVTSTGLATDIAKDQIKADASKGLKKIEKYLKFFPIVSVGVKYAF
jgi:hypothetical protein